jgi:GAF domain-containing protein
VNNPNRQQVRYDRLLSQWGGIFVLRMQAITQLISFLAAVLGIYYILIAASFSRIQVLELLLSVFVFVILVNLLILLYTALATSRARMRLDILLKGKSHPAGVDEKSLETQAWHEVMVLPWRYALVELATAYLLVVIPVVIFMTRIGGATTIQAIHVAIGGVISSTWVVLQETLSLDRMLAPVRRILLPGEYEHQSTQSGLRMSVRLQAIITTLILSAVLTVGPLGYQKLLNTSVIAANSVGEIQQFLVQALIIGAMILVFGFGLTNTLTQSFSQPVREMIRTMDEIGKGNSSQRAVIYTSDETAQLTIRLNQLLDELRVTHNELEKRVEERSLDVARKTTQLQTAAQIAREANMQQDINSLLRQTVILISERFGFYHAGIFLIDEGGEYAVLQAASSEGGQNMLARGHRLEVGRQGIVGAAANQSRPVVAMNVAAEGTFSKNPDLPETRSEAAFPLTARGKNIGVLDIQSTEESAFTQEDLEIIQTLADQIGLAIQNARLFAESQTAIRNLETTTAENLKRVWRERKAGDKRGYRFSSVGLSPMVQTGDQEVYDPENNINSNRLNIPITLRGQRIGNLMLQRKSGNKWGESDQSLATEVANQVGLALENARLLEESMDRAAKEKILGEISSKVSASVNLRSVMQTAVEELGRAIPGAEVEIQFKRTSGSRN